MPRKKLEVSDLQRLAKEVSLERSEDLMTIAQRLREEGKREGREEGRKEGMINLVEKQLLNKFKSVPEGYRKSLREQDQVKLEVIATKILDMEKVEELEEYLK